MPAPQPQLEQILPAPSAEEAAAIVAAVERFVRETAATVGPAEQAVDPWQRAAILEGVSREPRPAELDPWINT